MNAAYQLDPAVIHVKDLRLRTYIGFNGDEQEKLQDVILSFRLEHDATAAARADDVDAALDYRALTKEVIALVEGHRYLLLERLALEVLETLMAHPSVLYAEVEADKPHALRFADSVSVTYSASRDDVA